MEALKIHLKVKSDTIKIPALSKFIGRDVEIILLTESSSSETSTKSKYPKLKKLRGKINFDEDALFILRENSKL